MRNDARFFQLLNHTDISITVGFEPVEIDIPSLFVKNSKIKFPKFKITQTV